MKVTTLTDVPLLVFGLPAAAAALPVALLQGGQDRGWLALDRPVLMLTDPCPTHLQVDRDRKLILGL